MINNSQILFPMTMTMTLMKYQISIMINNKIKVKMLINKIIIITQIY